MTHPAPSHKSFSDRTSLYQEITDKIVAELEQGRVPWVQPWGGVGAPPLGLPRNAIYKVVSTRGVRSAGR